MCKSEQNSLFSARKPRQNVAMQAIMRRVETEQKQVTFKNASPISSQEEKKVSPIFAPVMMEVDPNSVVEALKHVPSDADRQTNQKVQAKLENNGSIFVGEQHIQYLKQPFGNSCQNRPYNSSQYSIPFYPNEIPVVAQPQMPVDTSPFPTQSTSENVVTEVIPGLQIQNSQRPNDVMGNAPLQIMQNNVRAMENSVNPNMANFSIFPKSFPQSGVPLANVHYGQPHMEQTQQQISKQQPFPYANNHVGQFAPFPSNHESQPMKNNYSYPSFEQKDFNPWKEPQLPQPPADWWGSGSTHKDVSGKNSFPNWTNSNVGVPPRNEYGNNVQHGLQHFGSRINENNSFYVSTEIRFSMRFSFQTMNVDKTIK